MRSSTFRRLILAAALAPLALGLAACGDSDKGGAGLTGEPIAKIAAPAGKTWADTVAVTPEGGVLMGNPDAPIKLVEYGSLSCPGCAKLAQDGFAPLVADYVGSGRVSFEFRSFAIHPQDVPLTVLVRCAPKESFFPLVEQIYGNFDAMNAPFADQAQLERAQATMQLPPEQRWGAFAEAIGYTQFFAQRGIAVDQAKTCLADPAKAKEVADFAEKYGKDGVTSTPTLMVNGAKLDDPSWNGLQVALQNAGAR